MTLEVLNGNVGDAPKCSGNVETAPLPSGGSVECDEGYSLSYTVGSSVTLIGWGNGKRGDDGWGGKERLMINSGKLRKERLRLRTRPPAQRRLRIMCRIWDVMGMSASLDSRICFRGRRRGGLRLSARQ